MIKFDIFNFIDDKIEAFLDYFDPIYKIVPAPSFGFAAVFTSSIAIFISFILYVSVDPTFSFFTHWISHLGAGPNGSSNVFNVGISMSSILLFFFYMYIIKDFRKRGANKILGYLFFLSNNGTCFGLLLVALFPYEIITLHAFAAFTFFISGLISSILYVLLILSTKGSNKIQALFALITTGFFCSHLIISIVIGLSNALDIRIAKFTEWLTLFAMLALIIESGFYHIRKKRLLYKKFVDIFVDINKFNKKNLIKLKVFVKTLNQKKSIFL